MDGNLCGVAENYIYDNMNAGDEHFQVESKLTLITFESKPRTYNSFSFFGTQVAMTQTGMFVLQQAHYIPALHEMPNDADIYTFRRVRALLAWVLHSHPEYTCVVNKAAHLTEKTWSKKHIANFNKVIRDALKTPERELSFKPLDMASIH